MARKIKARSIEGEGDKGLAAKLRNANPKPVEPTGDDLASGKLPQDVVNKFEPGAVVQKGDYVVKIVSFEAGHMGRDAVRYKKGRIDPQTGKLEWGPEILGNLEHIQKWLTKGA